LQQENTRLIEDKKVCDSELERLRRDHGGCAVQLREAALSLQSEKEKALDGEKLLAAVQAEVTKLREETKAQYVQLAELERRESQEEHRRATEQRLKEEAFQREKQARDAVETERQQNRSLRRQMLDVERQLRDLEETQGEADALRHEVKSMANANEELRSQALRLTSRVEELEGDNAKLSENKNTMKVEQGSLATTVKTLQAECAALRLEAERAQRELAEFYQLPNPCGVGMEVGLNEDAQVVVKSLISDMSAQLSQAVKVGDQILRVDGREVNGLVPADVRPLILGKRATYVGFTLLRAGQQVEVQLKRGAFGPEYTHVAPEHLDGPMGNGGHSRSSKPQQIAL